MQDPRQLEIENRELRERLDETLEILARHAEMLRELKLLESAAETDVRIARIRRTES